MRETLILGLLCLAVALASLGIVVWVVVDAAAAGLLEATILTLDGLLLIFIGLLASVVFGFCFLWTAREARLWEVLLSRKASGAPTGNPSSEEKKAEPRS